MSERDYGIDAASFRHAMAALEREGFERQAGRTTAWALRRSANVVRRKVRAAARPHRRTGHMASGVRVKYKGAGLAFESRVRATGVANMIVGGVRPHDIMPGKVMPLYGPGRSGVEGFATAVHHPGFGGDPFFHRGVKDAAPEINAIIDKSAETMASELAYRMRGRK